MRQHANADILHGNDIWRGSSCTTTALATEHCLQRGIVVREDSGNTESTPHDEDSEPDVGGLESLLDVDPGSLGLGGSHGDVLGSDHDEGS